MFEGASFYENYYSGKQRAAPQLRTGSIIQRPGSRIEVVFLNESIGYNDRFTGMVNFYR